MKTNNFRLLGILWAILSVPSALFAFLIQICGDPNGCVKSLSDFWAYILYTAGPVIFIAGAVAAFKPNMRKDVRFLLIFLPLVPILSFYFFFGR